MGPGAGASHRRFLMFLSCGQVSEVFWPHVLTWDFCRQKVRRRCQKFHDFRTWKENKYINGAFLCLFHMEHPQNHQFTTLLFWIWWYFQKFPYWLATISPRCRFSFPRSPSVPQRPTGTQSGSLRRNGSQGVVKLPPVVQSSAWNRQKTLDWVKNSGYTLWLCQNSYWKWPSRNSGFTHSKCLVVKSGHFYH